MHVIEMIVLGFIFSYTVVWVYDSENEIASMLRVCIALAVVVAFGTVFCYWIGRVIALIAGLA